MSDGIEPNVVVTALKAEYTRVRIRLDGARKRWKYSVDQVSLEASRITENEHDLHLLSKAILEAGGKLPDELPEDEEPHAE